MGLWAFDLAEIEIMQNHIKEEERGLINSTEKALANVAFIIILFLGVVFNDPSYFYYLMIYSYDCVLFAAVLYSVWYFFIRKVDTKVEKAPEVTEERKEEIDEFFNEDLDNNNTQIKKEDVVYQESIEDQPEENLNDLIN